MPNVRRCLSHACDAPGEQLTLGRAVSCRLVMTHGWMQATQLQQELADQHRLVQKLKQTHKAEVTDLNCSAATASAAGQQHYSLRLHIMIIQVVICAAEES